jgi:hypothetical protein
LQSCETSDGIFEDFKTLIPSVDASASQYKGFVVDISGAGNFIKVVGATMATCVLGDCDADVKKIAIKAGEIPSGADLENNKTATIDVSAYTEPVDVTPTEGKDGMKKATVTLTNIPSGGSITVYAWTRTGDILVSDDIIFTNYDKSPSDKTTLLSEKQLKFAINNGVVEDISIVSPVLPPIDFDYTRVSDTEFELDFGGNVITIQRNPLKDFTLW